MSNKVKAMQMYAGVDLIGSKTSAQASKNLTMEATSIGIKLESAKSKRTVVVPYSNVRGFELFPDVAHSAANDSYRTGEVMETFPSEGDAEALAAKVPGKRRGRPPKVDNGA